MRLFVCLATIGLLSSCGVGSMEVGLNERLFSLPSMTDAGRSCTMYQFGGAGGSSSGGSGSSGSSLFATQRQDGDRVVVEVMDGNLVAARRTYDEAFFRAGTVDELTVTSRVGDQLMLRYWGRAQDPFCTSLDLDAPP